MKKTTNIFKIIFHPIAVFFDKWIITPVTKLVLGISNLFNNRSKKFDKLMGKKSTLLIVSLLISVGIFLIVDNESNVLVDQYAEVLYNQKVNATYNEELYVVEGLPKTVDVTLIGQKRHIFLAKQSPSKGVTVDLTGLKPGNHKVQLKYSERIKSLDYKLDPSEVTVTIYEKVSDTRSLTVDILHQDDLDSKLHIQDVKLNRDTVIVKGAEYMLKKVATVRALVDVDEISNPKEGTITLKKVPLVAYDSNGNVLDVEVVPNNVTAKVTIASPSKTVPIRVVPKGNVALGKAISSLTPSASNVTIYGDETVLNDIDNIEVPIDVKNLSENKKFNVTISKPNGVTDLSVKDITVDVTLDNSVTKEFTNVAVSTENLNSKYKAQALSEEDSSVTVVVTGSQSNIDALTSSDISAYIDLKNYGVGEHEVPIKVKGDDLRLTYSSKTKKVKVKITQK